MSHHSGGSIINITSLGAEIGFPENPSYQVAKAALKQYICGWWLDSKRPVAINFRKLKKIV
jgi:short-subunit dehydrogenase